MKTGLANLFTHASKYSNSNWTKINFFVFFGSKISSFSYNNQQKMYHLKKENKYT